MRHAHGPVAISLLALLGPLAAEDTTAPPAVAATAPASTAAAPTTLIGTITALAAATHSLNVRPKAGDAVSIASDDHTVITVDGEPATYGDLKMDQRVTVVREGEHAVAVAAVNVPDSGKPPPKPKKRKKGE